MNSSDRERKALAALKLDPHSVDAQYELVLAYGQSFWKRERSGDQEQAYADAVNRVVNYHDNLINLPDKFREYRDAVYSIEQQGRKVDVASASIKPFYATVLKIAEKDVHGHIGHLSMYTTGMMRKALRNLKPFDGMEDDLRKRTLAMLEQRKRLEKEEQTILLNFEDPTTHEARRVSSWATTNLKNLRKAWLLHCATLKMYRQFDKLLPVVIKDIGSAHNISFTALRREIDFMKDEKRFATFDRLVNAAKKKRDLANAKKSSSSGRKTDRKSRRESSRSSKSTKSTARFKWNWPKIDIYDGTKPERLKPTTISIDLPKRTRGASICPLVRTGSRLYVLASTAQKLGFGSINTTHGDGLSANPNKAIGFLSLDEQGQPTGESQFFDLPSDLLPLHIVGMAASEKHLLIGTDGEYRSKNHGLYLLDLQTYKWKYFGIDEGVPVKKVTGLQQLSKGRVLCTGSTRARDKTSKDSWFIFDFNTLQIKDYQQSARWLSENDDPFRQKFLCVWENRGKVNGVSAGKIWNNLLSAQPSSLTPTASHRINPNEPRSYGACSACVFRGNLFCSDDDGVYQVGPDFRVAKSWQINGPRDEDIHGTIPGFSFIVPKTATYASSPLNGSIFRPCRVMPAETPMARRSRLVPCGEILLLIPNNGKEILGYDPVKEVWYGPVKTRRNNYALSDDKQVWLGGSTLRLVTAKDFIEAATSCNRVLTDSKFKTLRREQIDALPDFDRAKVAFSESDFEAADEFVRKCLKSEPKDFGALMLLGSIHDVFGNKDSTQAARAYRRAETAATSKGLKYMAAKQALNMYLAMKDRKNAAKQAKKILRRYDDQKGIRLEVLEAIIAQGERR